MAIISTSHHSPPLDISALISSSQNTFASRLAEVSSAMRITTRTHLAKSISLYCENQRHCISPIPVIAGLASFDRELFTQHSTTEEDQNY